MTTPKRLGVVMDPIAGINPAKDSSLAMLVEAQRRGYALWYFEQQDVRLRNGVAQGYARPLRVTDSKTAWFELGPPEELPLAALDLMLMRKDPPFGMEYIYTTYLLERAELAGVLVVNRPQSLRDMNEKVYTAWFPECCAPTLVTRDMAAMAAFAAQHGTVVCKPLEGMGGHSIFVVAPGDKNTNVVFETLTNYGQRFAIVQKYLPEIAATGDARVLLIDGEALPFALARIPSPADNRGNLAAGARAVARPLNERDRWLAAQIGPAMRVAGMLFVGIDVIGGFVTEINVTSPTGVRELLKQTGADAVELLMQAIERRLASR